MFFVVVVVVAAVFLEWYDDDDDDDFVELKKKTKQKLAKSAKFFIQAAARGKVDYRDRTIIRSQASK